MSKKTAERIIDSGNDYTIQVKRNQPSLFQEIERAIVEQTPLDYYEEHEKDHGRHSHWYVHVFDATDSYKAGEWKDLSRFIHVHKCTKYKSGKISHNDRIYISSRLETSAEYHHKGIRRHWTIENSLHWVKDVVHKEDDNRIKTDNGPVNSAIFSSIAINIHRKNGQHSITEAQVAANANFNELFDHIRT